MNVKLLCLRPSTITSQRASLVDTPDSNIDYAFTISLFQWVLPLLYPFNIALISYLQLGNTPDLLILLN